jgi:excisionase family DNA binding protein
MEPYYTPRQIIEQFNVKRPTLYSWIKQGWIQSFRIGAQHRIVVSEWDRFLREGPPKN